MNEPLDLTIALKKLHELALEEGDLGYAYWYAVAKLLKEAQRWREEGLQRLGDQRSSADLTSSNLGQWQRPDGGGNHKLVCVHCPWWSDAVRGQRR